MPFIDLRGITTQSLYRLQHVLLIGTCTFTHQRIQWVARVWCGIPLKSSPISIHVVYKKSPISLPSRGRSTLTTRLASINVPLPETTPIPPPAYPSTPPPDGGARLPPFFSAVGGGQPARPGSAPAPRPPAAGPSWAAPPREPVSSHPGTPSQVAQGCPCGRAPAPSW
jgi:hypothetical protein